MQNARNIVLGLLTTATLGWSPTASAILLSRLGGQAYYDTVLDVTWLADARLADTMTFGVPTTASVSPAAGEIGSSGGMMDWNAANSWIAGMNAANYLGFSDWRLPGLSPVDGVAFDLVFSNNGTTDFGYGATGVGWQTAGGAVVSELGWMHYGNLGNVGQCTPNDAAPGSCSPVVSGNRLVNTGPFSNLELNVLQNLTARYWTGVEDGTLAWEFQFSNGVQARAAKRNNQHQAWAVRDGDVEPAQSVPEPAGIAMMALGLIAAGAARRRC